MSVTWRPKTDRLEQLIQEEEARIAVLTEKRFIPETTLEQRWTPSAPAIIPQRRMPQSVFTQELPLRQEEEPSFAPIKFTTPVVEKPVITEEKPIQVPFWQRALQIFATPFEWIDENIIQPGWALAGTTIGVIPEVVRKPGEDFWEWKRRSWQGWETPGIDINVPWSDKPWRVDVKGVLAFAPWLLIPGAGQVGTATRAGVGIAGMLGKAGKIGRIAGGILEVVPGAEKLGITAGLERGFGTVGQVLGKAVQYSPWGLVERSAGVAIKGGFRAVGGISERVSTSVGEKLFGKYVPPPISPTIAKITAYAVETVGPAMKAMKKALPEELRVKQLAITRALQKDVLEGRLPISELRAAESKALSEIGALRPKFAITEEVLAARKAEKIAEIENKIANGEYTETVGKALITKIEKSREFRFRGVVPEKVTKESTEIIEQVRNALVGTNRMDEVLVILPDGTALTGREFKGIGAFQHLAEDLPPVQRWLDAGVVRTGLEESGAFFIEIRGGLSQEQFSKLSKLISSAREVRVDFGYFENEITKSFEGTPNIVRRQLRELIGEPGYPKDYGIPDTVGFTQAEVDELSTAIMEATENGLLNMDARNALTDLLLGVADNLPEPHHITAWGEAFGLEFAKAMRKFRTPQQANNFFDALQIGKSLVSSADVSFTLRQGLFMSLAHPTLVPKWFGRQVKALLSEKLTFDMDDALRADPAYKRAINEGGVYFAPQREISVALAEEAFPSRIAERIPGVKRSQRAANTFINEARLDTWKLAEAAMKAQGATSEHLKLMGQFINFSSGRGTLPQSLDKYMPALNAVLFSPRLQAATLQLPRQIGRMMLSKNPYMRKEGAKTLVTFVGGGSALLGLLNLTGVSKVETDPRSGDFGKIKIGETRLDIWRGYIQYARFVAQLLSGERKSAYGNMNKAERGEIAGRFIQSKLSPVAGLISDIWRGENYQGEPLFNDTTGFSKIARERFLPLAVQDIIDAAEMNGVNGALIAAPSLIGIGALTYVNDFVKVKERIAKDMGYESWDDIDPKTQREIENRNAELQAATIAFDRQVMGTAWGDWRLAGNAIENVFKQNVDDAVAEYQQIKDGVQFNKKITDAFTAKRGGYDAREKEERFSDIVKRLGTQNTLEALVNLGPEQVAIKMYNDALWGGDMYDKFNNYRFDEAKLRKQQLRQVLGEQMFNYIEDYLEVKYETFPEEFQQLLQARETMRPYWEVRDRVIKLFKSERFADSLRGRALISKVRRQMRLFNPNIEIAYQQFYAKQ